MRVYKLEVIDRDNVSFTVLGSRPVLEAYEDWRNENPYSVAGKITIIGFCESFTIARDFIKSMCLTRMESPPSVPP